MDSHYRVNIGKWLPSPSAVLEQWFADSSTLMTRMGNLAEQKVLIIQAIAGAQACHLEACERIVIDLEDVTAVYKSISVTSVSVHPIYRYKMSHFLTMLKRKLNVLARFARNLINEIVDGKSEEQLRIIFRLVNVYNDILDMNIDVSDTSTNVFYNDCPSMLEPMKKISVTRILQELNGVWLRINARVVEHAAYIAADWLWLFFNNLKRKHDPQFSSKMMAKNRAEDFCHELIDCLLANYEPREKIDSSTVKSGDEISENSSVEIYRALTRHLTPPIDNSSSTTTVPDPSNTETVQILIDAQNEQVIRLLRVVQDVSPKLLGTDALKASKGETRLRSSAIRRVKNYYQEIAWGALTGILDHVVLWWSPEALATRHCHGAQQLKDWLSQFIQRNRVPQTARPALQNLCDALGYHATITEWDHLFRLAYMSAFKCQSKASSTEGTDTGQMFAELYQLLVRLSNECEAGGEWVIGAPLMELPLSEQIVVLHRLDHSVHTARLWIVQEAKIIAHTWELDVFFLLVKGDIANCLEELSYLKLADHTATLSTDSVSVQVYVCAKMRAKIVSEVNVNIDLLQKCSATCTDILAKICRVISLANLHMCFPRSSHWRKGSDVAPVSASLYVEPYFEKVLLPVLEVIEDHETSNMILKIMCEAWLDYIYLHRIKFSEHGAMQLLADFAHVSKWVTSCSIISQNVRDHLLKNEVLRRCEGVGRLLLRNPGEVISMRKRLTRRTNERGSPQSPGLERMPAEMYVPNQKQWLELRASKRYNFCCTD